MTDATEPALLGPPAAAVPAALSVSAAPGYRLAMKFNGSGSEYFRIWIVNLLLILVTLGLYYPFAKVRRLRYFYGNTTLGGSEFDFHGNPWRMLRGFLLMAALMGAYALATNVSPWATLVALLLLAALWPALFRASMQFRLANTSWRGLRFQFHGNSAGAYRAMWPMLLAMVLYLGSLAFLAPEPGAKEVNAWLAVASGAGALLVMLLTPWFWWSVKRYQHDHYGLGPVRTELRAGAGSFYGVFLKGLGIALLFLLPMIALIAALAMGGPRGKPAFGAMVALPIVMLICYLGMLIVAGSFVNARLQNLVWSQTKSRAMRFESTVRVGALAGLTARNWLLIALTLGLYLPFARVARARLLLESVVVTTRHPPEALSAALHGMKGDAAGDASADLIGIEIGL